MKYICYLLVRVHLKLSKWRGTASPPPLKARQIRWSLSHWQRITNDSTILQCVKGIEIEFRPGVIPFQANMRPSTFNQWQHDIVAVEIDKLRLKGVLKVSSPELGEFVSPIFLRPKQMSRTV